MLYCYYESVHKCMDAKLSWSDGQVVKVSDYENFGSNLSGAKFSIFLYQNPLLLT